MSAAARKLFLYRSPAFVKQCLGPCRFGKSSSSLPRRPASCHTYTTSAAFRDAYLLQVLKSEIDRHESRPHVSKERSLKGSTGPFEIIDKPGTEEIMLVRALGKEKISIACIVETQYPDAADEDVMSEEEVEVASSQGEPHHVLHLFVTLKKETEVESLELECSFRRGDPEVCIESITLSSEDLDSASEVAGPKPYQGPPIEELDEDLQRAFHDLLKARGLTAKVATYVLDYMTVKERREYSRWLCKVEAFFSNP